MRSCPFLLILTLALSLPALSLNVKQWVEFHRPSDAQFFGCVASVLSTEPRWASEWDEKLRLYPLLRPEPLELWDWKVYVDNSELVEIPKQDCWWWADRLTSPKPRNTTTIEPPPPPPPPPPVTGWCRVRDDVTEVCGGGTRQETNAVTTLPCKGHWRVCLDRKPTLLCTCHYAFFTQINGTKNF